MTDQPNPKRDVALVVPARGGGEARISLHPVSLALVLAEVIEDAARHRCRRSDHGAPEVSEGGFEYCSRCGTSLPDTDEKPAMSWLPTVYRSFTRGVR
jgi:hypothetical protein